MQIVVDTSESDDNLKVAVEHALKELERRTGHEFQVLMKPKGAPTQVQQAPEPPVQRMANNVATARAEDMKKLMGSIDLSIIGNPAARNRY